MASLFEDLLIEPWISQVEFALKVRYCIDGAQVRLCCACTAHNLHSTLRYA